jgi:hypothetical protein
VGATRGCREARRGRHDPAVRNRAQAPHKNRRSPPRSPPTLTASHEISRP